jgi:hypothetical protein
MADEPRIAGIERHRRETAIGEDSTPFWRTEDPVTVLAVRENVGDLQMLTEAGRAACGQSLLFRAHTGRSGNVGPFSEADIRSARAFDRHVPFPDSG